MLKNNHSTFILSLKSRKGQVALFVALIFQILFLFFAMVINVGLLVHHKINLQNSVDLAAYYGAAKQAENLNAIGHMNYQIRQSWKLLAWRYRMLGSGGEFEYHPFKKPNPPHLDESQAYEGIANENTDPIRNGFQEAPAFCITYIPFKPMPKDENTCKYMASRSGVKLFRPPKHFGFLQVTATVTSISNRLLDRAQERCRAFGSYNYLMLGKFVVAYNADQRDRMIVINELSRTMSSSVEDFYDLDGESVSTGVKNTFQNNLTAPNRSAVTSFKMHNSLGDPKCGVTGNSDRPVKWLSPIKIYPGFSYIDTKCDRQRIDTVGKEFNASRDEDDKGVPIHYKDGTVDPSLASGINELLPYIGYRSNLVDTYNFSLGVEKNPWCMAYVGVSAETQPVIPFSPFGKVTLKARSFVKPFGGRIGPWYSDRWSRRDMDAQNSDGNNRTDDLIPPRVSDLASLTTGMADPKVLKWRAANYSRYVGDPYGLKSAMMIGNYGKSIYELDPAWAPLPQGNSPNADMGSNVDIYNGSNPPNFADWDALPFNYAQTTGDILAWAKDQPSKMRLLEMSAVAPNAFDIAYYSIEPDFYHNYFTRMRDGFIRKVGSSVAKSFRPDIGYHKGFRVGAYNFDEFSVKDQIAEVGGIVESMLPIKSKFTYSVLNWKNLLTGWGSKNLKDYSLNPGTFGNCTSEPVGGVPNPGNCVVGGSTGYSVKMVSSDYLSSELQLGGENTGKGKILNLPPSDF
ncbi:Tad domain-containing protein [Bdellovibrio svalbardensis]|uniref:Tad domain-containing protein n=1 Tax=Bdellovibrio svalbardensis TaxID=2972972 RepID=A0ABT6DE10_9BACT|nr:Tad domain-containing protein [Bdellovibrio svalbardensis]MDG0815062.1 Tad domain-containing protein [Bdellovibrio svalbardensis]